MVLASKRNCGSPSDLVCEGLEVTSEDLPLIFPQPDVQLSQQLELVYQIIVFTKPTGSISSTLSFPQLFVDEPDNYSLKTFSNSSILFLQSVCLHPANPVFTLLVLCVCLSFRHDDYVVALLCLYPSTYSAASSSSLRNFLTLKFLCEEFIKIAYSPPSSRRNTLSIGIRARYSLVLCDFGLTI